MEKISSKEFNSEFRISIELKSMTESLGEMLTKLVSNVVLTSKIKNRGKSTLKIIESDMLLESLETFERLSRSSQRVNNPYSYYVGSLRRMLSTIILQRFSSAATKDVLGCSITARGAGRVVNRFTFISINEFDVL